MRGGEKQVWVTSALRNEEALNAMVLGCSLRRTYTCRKVAVIVSPKVDKSLQRKLYYVFDLVFPLDDHDNVTGLKEADLAKLTALETLWAFELGVYLSPSMVAVRNADGIFGEYEGQKGWKVLLPEDVNGSLNMFLFRPSVSTYKGIVKDLLERRHSAIIDGGSCVTSWMEAGRDGDWGEVQTLDGKYYRKLQSDRMLLGNEEDIFLADLGTVDLFTSGTDIENFGIFERVILQYWQKIYQEDVRPLIEAEPFELDSTLMPTKRVYSQEPIAIVGMSCRFPGSNNLDEFWNLLFAGEDGTSNPPPDRWLREQSSSRRSNGGQPEWMKTKAGFLSTPVDEFDANFFGLSPKEILSMDPQHRLLHELVWEGLEDACISPQDLKGSRGSVFIGSWTNDYKDVLKDAGQAEFFRTYMGNSIGAAAARISHLLGMVGPSVGTEGGCSSSMVAVHSACRSLRMGETGMALACGVNLLLLPIGYKEMPMMVSKERGCKTFCEKADGFTRAEGCGVLVLKRLSDAVRDKDKIWALIRGSAMVQEGISKSLGTPTVHCESMAMSEALLDAGVEPEEVSYVEAHGTGTVVGDPLEVSAIAKAYHSSLRKEPLLIGSAKTNVGHTESCSGITGIIKVVLAMRHEIIPPHINFEKLNPAIDLDAVPARIPLEPVDWKAEQGKVRIAGVSSFGITGTDAHLILEESPPKHVANPIANFKQHFKRPVHLLKLSAKKEQALDLLLEKYQESLSRSGEALEDLAYSGNVGRANFSHRAVIIAKSKEEVVARIKEQKILKREIKSEADVGKICFLFPGQGSQYPGMGKELYQSSPVFKVHFDHCAHILKASYCIDITREFLGEGVNEEISRTIYNQTSLFCVQYALLKLWESWGVRPDFALGHSLGEPIAAVCAGILNVEDALKLVAERSLLIDQLPGGKMLVVRASMRQVGNLLKDFEGELDFAAINSREQTVVAGNSDVVLEFAKLCANNGIKSTVLESTHAFHSRHMDPILEEVRQIASTIVVGSGNGCEYISSVMGKRIQANTLDAEYWVRHTRAPVEFLEASRHAVELGCRTFIEIGPQPILSTLTVLNNEINLTCLPSLKRKEGDWETILNSLGQLYLKGLPIDWQGFDQFYDRRKVSLPSYPFIRKRLWPDGVGVKGSTIHPLLGSSSPNPSATKLFKSGLSLTTHEYIKDHTLGRNIIFPGAAYLEMCLAAGLASLENAVDGLGPPIRPMKVENLRILAPLCLQDSTTTEVHTAVESTTPSGAVDWNGMGVQIFQKMQGESSSTSPWLLHAKATFSPLPTTEEQRATFDVDIREFRRRLDQEHSSIQNQFPNMLEKLTANGFKPGPSFRLLARVWKNEHDSTLLARVSTPPQVENEQLDYILHPTLLDAMIQSILFTKLSSDSIGKKIFVPIRIGKFVWLAPNQTEETYICAYDGDAQNGKEKDKLSFSTYTSLLLDGDGNVLAIMSRVELIDTTVKVIESVLEQQTSSLPELWEEVWRAKIGPNKFRANLSLLNSKPLHDGGFQKEMIAKYNVLDEDRKRILAGLDKLVYFYILQALYELGWEPYSPGNLLTGSRLEAELSIRPQHHQYFCYMLQVLEDEGILQREGRDPDKWLILASPPTPELLATELASSGQPLINHSMIGKLAQLLCNIGTNLSSILTEKQSVLQILYPDKTQVDTPSAASFYTQYGELCKVEELTKRVAEQFLTGWKQEQHVGIGGERRMVVRILEIGAGAGTYTKSLLETLQNIGIEFELTFTDISAASFPPAQKMFEEYGDDAIHYKKLNIEEDPIAQGFIPCYYDYVCTSEVFHATKDIRESLRNVHCLLKPMGRFDLHKTTRNIRFETYTFGLLKGFWRFTDGDVRPSPHCVLSPRGREDALKSSGFEMLSSFPYANGNHSLITAQKKAGDEAYVMGPVNKLWLIFHHEPSPLSSFLVDKIPHLTNRQVVVVLPGEEFTSSSSNTTFTVRKTSEEDFIRVMEAMQGRAVEGIIYCWSLDKEAANATQEDILQPYVYLAKSILQLKQQLHPRLFAITNGVVPLEENNLAQFSTSSIWGFTKSLQNENMELNCRVIDMVGEANKPEGMMQLFYEIWNDGRETQVAYNGATRYTPKLQPLKSTKEDLKLPDGLDRFQLVLPGTNCIKDLQFGPLELFALGEYEVEIQVKASALNFRDVFSVLKPTEQFKGINAVGFDFAGVVKRVGTEVTKWFVGDEVFGLNLNGKALPSHVKMDENDVFSVGEGMTFCEATTLPAVFATSYHSLIEVAKVTSSDTVLIHTASGGVGLSAIQLCKHIGAKMICTAGSKRKQNYLRSLGIQHVFHSRDTRFGVDILRVTGGKGVDVVLNSLTSEGFKEASLMACAKGARFVEMSKLSIWTPEEVAELRSDVDYTIVDISVMNGVDLRRLMSATKMLSVENVIRPLPYVRFNGMNIRSALHYLQTAKHIGKVVCVMPEVSQKNGQTFTETPLFNPNSTYLITGGLGGIGFVVCQWMVEKGAKYVLLAGRNPPNLSKAEAISQLNSQHNAEVTWVELEVSDFSQCEELFRLRIPKMGYPPLRGVMHCAGVLQDALVQNQTWANISSTLKSKVEGTLNLHELTRDSPHLEHFVLFSSITSLFGSPGQSNYAAGNNFEDTFAKYRNSIGLAATSINWGQWGQVGLARELDLPGFKPLSNLQGLAALEFALESQLTQICAANIESIPLLVKFYPYVSSYLDERVWKKATENVPVPTSALTSSKNFWELYESKGGDLSGKQEAVQEMLIKLLRNILKMDASEPIPLNQEFPEMGMDSLMFIEIRNALQVLLGDRVFINASALREASNVELLSATLLKLMEGDGEKILEDAEKPI